MNPLYLIILFVSAFLSAIIGFMAGRDHAVKQQRKKGFETYLAQMEAFDRRDEK